MRSLVPFLAVLAALGAPAGAQVQSRPTDPPLVTADRESWFLLREPIQFAGELYYAVGPAVFFNGHVMVRTGHYNGVPLYADTTVEPFSVVFVPVSRGLMQPYERPRHGALAGTTGSRPPSFPVRVVPETMTPPMAAVAPTAPPSPPGAIGVYTPPAPARPIASSVPITDAVGMSGVNATQPGTAARPVVPLVSVRTPAGNDGIWIEFGGERWISAGAAVPLVAADFVRVGDYAGFPVFARRELTQEVIYLPSRAGLVAPYRLKAR